MKKTVLSILLLSLIFLCSCSKTETPTPTQSENNCHLRPKQLSENDFDISRRLDPESILQVDDGILLAVPATKDTDFQTTLYYFDSKSQQIIPTCAQPNCTHDKKSTNCTANLTGLDAWRGLYYTDGWVYVAGQGNGEYGGQYCLWRIALDGSGRDVVVPFGRMAANDTLPSGDWMIHRGYVYYTKADDEKTISVYRQNLQKKGEEKLYSVSGIGSQLLRLCGVDDGFYFETCYFTDESLENFEGGLYYYNLTQKEAQLVLDGCCKPYVVGYDVIYYMTADSLCTYDPASGETKVIAELGDFGYLTYDEKYLYCETEQALSVFTPDGNKIAELPCVDGGTVCQNIYCHNSTYLAGVGEEKDDHGEYRVRLFLMDKESLTNHPHWDVMPLKDLNNK